MTKPQEQTPESGQKPRPAPSRTEVSLATPLYGVAQPKSTSKPKVEAKGIARITGSPIALAIVILLAIGGMVAYAHSQHDDSPGTLKVGDCFNLPAETGSEPITSSVTDIPSIPCDKPHDSQVYAEPKIPDSSFPDIADIESQADDACSDPAALAGIAKDAPTGYSALELYPQDAASFASQHNFICAFQFTTDTLTQSWVNAAAASAG